MSNSPKKSERVFDECSIAWISDEHDICYSTPSDSELDEKEWAQFVHADEAEKHIIALEKQLEKAVALIESIHIDDCGWNLHDLDKEVGQSWHRANNEKIEQFLKEFKENL